MTNTDSTVCLGNPSKSCNKTTENTDAVKCSLCARWYHTQCQGLNKTMFNYFSNTKIPYICLGCADSELPTLVQGRSLFKSLADRVEKLEGGMAVAQGKITDLEKAVDFENSNNFIQNVEKLIKENNDDQAEINRRRNNVVIFNLPQSSSQDPKIRKDDDQKLIDKITSLTSENTTPSKVKTIFRVNNTSKENSPCITKVVFESEEDKWLTLKNTNKLALDPVLKHVKIFPDLTIKQRKNRQELQKVRDSRNAKLSNDNNNPDNQKKWVIKGSKLVLLKIQNP